MTQRIANKSEMRTSTLIGLSMAAGVGLKDLPVSTWWTLILDTTSVLVQRVVELVGSLMPAQEVAEDEGKKAAVEQAASTGSWWPLLIAIGASFVVGVIIDRWMRKGE